MRPAVFLDRDDTLIHCTDITPDGDLGDPALVKLLPGVAQGIAKLRAAGFPLVVVSNQGGVARGRYTTLEVDRVNRRVNELLDDAVTRFYYCPWHPKGIVPEFTREHPWRKPQPGMLLQAAHLGLGSCPIGGFDEAALTAALNIPPGESPALVIALGHCAYAAPRRMRKARD